MTTCSWCIAKFGSCDCRPEDLTDRDDTGATVCSFCADDYRSECDESEVDS